MEKTHEDNKKYVRVTDVLSPFSKLGGIDPLVLAKAADRGTRVHKYCEAYALDLFVTEVDEDCKNYFEAFKIWYDEMVKEVIHIEVPVKSETWGFCTNGIDLIAKLKGDHFASIIDYKTPQTTSLTWQLQTAAYQILAEDDLGLDIERRICLRLPRTPISKCTVIEYLDEEKDRQLFLNALELYKFFH